MAVASGAPLNYEESKCSWCKNLLSVSPILIVDKDEVFCGRCKDMVCVRNSNPQIQQHIMYENFAKNYEFPCRYKNEGCEKILKWVQVEEHEKNCKFGKMECFFNLKEFKEENGCEWNGDNGDFFKHFENEHLLPILRVDKLDIWTEPKSQLCKICYKNDTFLLVLLLIDNIYYALLIGDNRKRPMKFKIEMLDVTKKNAFIFLEFSKYLPCNMGQMKKIGLSLNVQDIIPKYLTVYVGDRGVCHATPCTARTLSCCQVCQEPMTLPVFSCTSYHDICKNCSEKNKRCQFSFANKNTCNENFKRNRNLEDQYLRGHFRCHFQSCFYHGNIFNIEHHYRTCKCFCLKTPLSKLNFFYEMIPNRQQFEFDDKFVELIVNWDQDDLKFELLFYTISLYSEFKFEITIQNNSSTEKVFPIIPNLCDNRSNRVREDSSLIIPRTLIDKNGTGELTYKLNISVN